MKAPLDVLIVEDSPSDTKLILRELRRSGFVPRWERVDTPVALRAALQRLRWQLVISDSSAPQLDTLRALALAQELQLVAEGHRPRENALRLALSVKTVVTHRLQLMERLGIHDVPGLVRYAIREGIVRAEP